MYIYTPDNPTNRHRTYSHPNNLLHEQTTFCHGSPQELEPTLGQAPTGARVCCMLRPEYFIDPSSLGTHQDPSERNGIIYTGGGGFIDTAHLRYCCDNTKLAYDRISAANGASGTVINLTEGTATLTAAVPRNLWTKVARDIGYDDGLSHEIWTYWKYLPGAGNSSFSPEDLFSNNLGTIIAELVINSSPANFNVAVTAVLNNTLTSLKAQPINETNKAWNKINNCWMSIAGLLKLNYMTLMRRNFDILPWKVGHPSDFPTPQWVIQKPGSGAYYYSFKCPSLTMNIQTTTFSARIQDIRNDASKRYGTKYDQPSCP